MAKPTSRGNRKSRLRLAVVVAAVAVGVVAALAGGAFADNTIADGDGVTPITNQSMAVGNVDCGVATPKTALIAISRNGNSSPGINVFGDGATVTISVLSTTGDLSASITGGNTITLPSDWGLKSNNTLSASVSSTVTVDSSTEGAGSGSVTYRASGLNQGGTAITRDDTMTVTWTTGSCASPDTTPPDLSLGLSTSDGSDYVDGSTLYYNDQSGKSGSFTVTATASDTESGIDKVDFPNVFTTSDGGDDTSSPYGNTYSWTGAENVSGSQTVTAYNGVGLTATADFTLTRDVTGPSISVSGVTNGAKYTLGDTLPSPTCGTATDAGSGVASQDSTPSTIDNRNTNGVGSIVYTCSATDNVGNEGSGSATIYVIYGASLVQFLQPINGTAHTIVGSPNVSTFKAGSTVPVKVQVLLPDGTIIQPLSAQWVTPQDAGPTAQPIDETVTAGTPTTGTSYVWDSTGQFYQYNWGTSKGGSGHYWLIGAKLDDGQTYTVYISLR